MEKREREEEEEIEAKIEEVVAMMEECDLESGSVYGWLSRVRRWQVVVTTVMVHCHVIGQDRGYNCSTLVEEN